MAGVDGGGLLLPGRGLWEFYPAMVAAPKAAAVSCAAHLCLALGALAPVAAPEDPAAA